MSWKGMLNGVETFVMENIMTHLLNEKNKEIIICSQVQLVQVPLLTWTTSLNMPIFKSKKKKKNL